MTTEPAFPEARHPDEELTLQGLRNCLSQLPDPDYTMVRIGPLPMRVRSILIDDDGAVVFDCEEEH